MLSLLYILLAVIMGAVISIYLPMNSSVARHFGSAITANISFFLGALLTAIVIFALFGDLGSILRLRKVPPYLFLTGVISAFMVLGTTFLIPRLGARKLFILLIGGQIIMAMIIGHFGILESPRDPISLRKLVGAALLVLGSFVSMV
jgi:bacterial/archaeal transporter family-2 protein